MTGLIKNLMGAGLSAGQARAVNGTLTFAATATGTTLATAYPISTEFTEFTTVPASSGAVLPTEANGISSGDQFWVANQTATPLIVYAPSGGIIGFFGVSLTLPAGKSALIICRGSNSFFAILSA